MLGLFITHIPLWRIVNSLVAVFLMLLISKYATARVTEANKRKVINIALCCGLFALYPNTLTESMVWYTGSFTHLWAVATFLCALLPFYYAIIGRKIVYKISYGLFFLALLYACYLEQELGIIAGFGALTFIFLKAKKMEIPRMLIWLYIFALINIAVCLLSPGPRIRMNVEIPGSYPNYPMLTLVDKIYQAVNWTSQHVLITSNLLFLLFSTLIFAVCYSRDKDNKVVSLISAVPMLFSLLSMIPFKVLLSRVGVFQGIDIQGGLDKFFFSPTTVNPNSLNDLGFQSLLPPIACLTIILFTAVLLFFAFKEMELKFVSVLLYLGALASTYLFTFSPTIFASGDRIFFTGDILMLLIAGLLLRELLINSDIMQKLVARFIFYALVAFGMGMSVAYIIGGIDKVWAM
jgi:hypothetical protein